MFFPFLVDTDREWEFRQTFPYAVVVILLLCLGIHIWMESLPPIQKQDIIYSFGVIKADLQWYSPLTCTFLHDGWLHLLGNGYFLWI